MDNDPSSGEAKRRAGENERKQNELTIRKIRQSIYELGYIWRDDIILYIISRDALHLCIRSPLHDRKGGR